MERFRKWQNIHAIFIFVAALGLGVWHGLSKGIDVVTVGLLLLAAFAPYLHRIKEIQLPGGGKVSLEETEKAEKDTQEAEEDEKTPAVKEKLKDTIKKQEEAGFGWRIHGGRKKIETESRQSAALIDRAYNSVYSKPGKAVSILGKALETGIAQLYGAVPGPGEEKDIKNRGVMGLARDLQRDGIITEKTFESIRHVFSITSRVKHGYQIDLGQAERVIDIGNDVLGILRTKTQDALEFRKPD